MSRARRRVAVFALVVAGVPLVACERLAAPAGPPPPAAPTTAAPPSAAPPTGEPSAASPGTTADQVRRAVPWPQRPVVTVRFDVAADLRSVQGREIVRFTPDLPTCELVFRAWPNKPETAAAGSSLTVTSVAVDGVPVRPRVVAAGAPAGAPGSLVAVPLRRCLGPGESVTAGLGFTVVLGEGAPERVGRSSKHDMAWFATAFPLLAWERGRGWAREPAVQQFGEAAVSEDFALDLTVLAPATHAVLGTGTPAAARERARAGARVHRFRAAAVRDVAVTVCRCAVLERAVAGTRLRVGTPAGGTAVPAQRWADLVSQSLRRLTAMLGPQPYRDLWVSVIPDVPTGIEFPGAIQFSDTDPDRFPALVSHEVAHLWFYGLVGNNQGRDPWLDEAFATFAQAAVDGDSLRLDAAPAHLRDDVGRPMTFWAGPERDAYGEVVYTHGGAALAEARRRVGAARFDAALRAYVDANAFQVATPDDVARAFTALPEVLDVLRRAGALPR